MDKVELVVKDLDLETGGGIGMEEGDEDVVGVGVGVGQAGVLGLIFGCQVACGSERLEAIGVLLAEGLEDDVEGASDVDGFEAILEE